MHFTGGELCKYSSQFLLNLYLLLLFVILHVFSEYFTISFQSYIVSNMFQFACYVRCGYSLLEVLSRPFQERSWLRRLWIRVSQS